jgi:hypothetical protein
LKSLNSETKLKSNRGFFARRLYIGILAFSLIVSAGAVLIAPGVLPVKAQNTPSPACSDLDPLIGLPPGADERVTNIRPTNPRVDIRYNYRTAAKFPWGQNRYYVITLHINCNEGNPDDYIVEWTKDGQALPPTHPTSNEPYDFRFELPAADSGNYVPALWENTGNAANPQKGNPVTTQGGADTIDVDQPRGIAGFLIELTIALLKMIAQLLNKIFNGVVAPMIELLLRIQVHKFEFTEVILPVWLVIRNLMNIFFMLALIAVSLSTLFRLNEKWNYKNVLVDIAVMALLINFSLTIAQAVLGIAQTIQSQFLPANSDVIKVLAAQLMVAPFNILQTDGGGTVSALVTAFVYLFLALSAFLTFVAIAGFLIVRIVALWILLMTSPIAYGLYVLPSTSKYAKQWWSNFLKYAFFTPLLALAITICAVLAKSQATYLGETMRLPASFIGASPTANNSGLDEAFATMIVNILSSVLIIGCLFMALKITTSLGIAGSGMIISKTQGLATKGARWAGRNTFGASARALGRKKRVLSSKYLAVPNKDDKLSSRAIGKAKRLGFNVLNPGTSFKQLQKRIEKKTHDAEHIAEAGARRISTLRRTGGVVDTKENLHAIAHAEDNDNEHFERMKASELRDVITRAKDPEQRRRAIKSALKSGKLDDVIKDMVLTDAKGNPILDAHGMPKYAKGEFTDDKVHEFFNQYVDPHSTDGHIFIEDAVNVMAKEKGKLAYYGHQHDDLRKRNEDREDIVKETPPDKIGALDAKGVLPDDDHNTDASYP